jgi:signal transduction histidine kinase
VVRLEIEAIAAQLTTTRDDAAKFRQIAERTSAEQQKERDTLARELATARGQIEANVTLLNKFRDDAAEFRQIADARAALGPAPNSLISQATQAVEPALQYSQRPRTRMATRKQPD